MSKCYLVKKNRYDNLIVTFTAKLKGYHIKPKNSLKYEGVIVNEMIITNRKFIEYILHKKAKKQINSLFMKVIDIVESDDDSDDARETLDILARYRVVISDKYMPFLSEKYIALLLKKIELMERELKQKIILSNYKEDTEIKRSR